MKAKGLLSKAMGGKAAKLGAAVAFASATTGCDVTIWHSSRAPAPVIVEQCGTTAQTYAPPQQFAVDCLVESYEVYDSFYADYYFEDLREVFCRMADTQTYDSCSDAETLSLNNRTVYAGSRLFGNCQVVADTYCTPFAYTETW